MSETKKISRRKFIGASAAVASGMMIVPRHVLGGRGYKPPSEQLNIAGIGIGGRGQGDLDEVSSENIVALCDVDHAYAGKVFAQYPKARKWTDYRKMLDEQKDIDAVVIATPDHTHAVITMAAMRAGKHVYCQKPLTHDVFEARRLAEAAQEAGVVTQMGIQGHSGQLGGDCIIDRDGIVRFAYRSRDPADRPPMEQLMAVLHELDSVTEKEP